MKEPRSSVITDSQQALLGGVQVRLLTAPVRGGFDRLLVEEHYLKSAQVVGEPVRHVAE